MGGETTVGWGGEIGCNRIAGRCRSFAQGNSSASVEPSNAVVKLSPPGDDLRGFVEIFRSNITAVSVTFSLWKISAPIKSFFPDKVETFSVRRPSSPGGLIGPLPLLGLARGPLGLILHKLIA
jgi:hypothetical protein